MAVTPRVQLSLKGRLLSEVAFAGPQLRIGRMRENDVVVNNLAVSRFHATLRREGDGFVLDDLGSENGTQLNGERISGSVPVKATDVIQLGKYELRIVMQAGPQIAGPPKAKANDAWDSSQTFLAMEPAPAAASKAPATPAPKAPEPRAVAQKAAAPMAPPPAPELAGEPELALDPDGAFAFGEEDIAAAAESPELDEASEVATGPSRTPNPEHTSLFDFGAQALADPAADLAPAAPAPLAAPAAPVAAAPAGNELHAGLIVQREGKLHQLRPWESGEIVAGRAPECEIVLADAGVSRRHASFTLAPEGYVVRDLGSVNGIYVNGQRTKQHVLAVGDVVRIESFELTFVLDHQPIGSEVSGPTPAAAKANEHTRATQFSLEAPALESEAGFELAPLAGDPGDAPAQGDDAPFEANTDGFEILSPDEDPLALPAPPESEAPRVALPEADLIPLDDVDEDEKPEVEAQPMARAAAPLRATDAPQGALHLRVRVDAARLSPRAREALAALAEEGVALEARVEFEREER
jgi:pSer/pThr/pTyr-binding forkhead associated (FHA) protein